MYWTVGPVNCHVYGRGASRLSTSYRRMQHPSCSGVVLLSIQVSTTANHPIRTSNGWGQRYERRCGDVGPAAGPGLLNDGSTRRSRALGNDHPSRSKEKTRSGSGRFPLPVSYVVIRRHALLCSRPICADLHVAISMVGKASAAGHLTREAMKANDHVFRDGESRWPGHFPWKPELRAFSS